MLPIIERLVLSRILPSASVLDVCCGTGQLAEILDRRDYQMIGLDASEAMIAFARENAPGIPFVVADVRDFSIDRRFDAAYSVFESLNHVPDIDGLRLAFNRIRGHLTPGAPFLFDLNREEAFIQFWNDTDAIVSDDNVCVMASSYNESSQVGTCDVTVFDIDEHAGGWRRTDFRVRQTCHKIADVSNALADAGFRDITLHDARDLGMMSEIGFARTFFLALA